MKVKITDLSKILKNYSNKWVALTADSMRVIAVGNEPKTVLDQARKKGFSHPVITRAPKDYSTYIL